MTPTGTLRLVVVRNIIAFPFRKEQMTTFGMLFVTPTKNKRPVPTFALSLIILMNQLSMDFCYDFTNVVFCVCCGSPVQYGAKKKRKDQVHLRTESVRVTVEKITALVFLMYTKATTF